PTSRTRVTRLVCQLQHVSQKLRETALQRAMPILAQVFDLLGNMRQIGFGAGSGAEQIGIVLRPSHEVGYVEVVGAPPYEVTRHALPRVSFVIALQANRAGKARPLRISLPLVARHGGGGLTWAYDAAHRAQR